KQQRPPLKTKREYERINAEVATLLDEIEHGKTTAPLFLREEDLHHEITARLDSEETRVDDLLLSARSTRVHLIADCSALEAALHKKLNSKLRSALGRKYAALQEQVREARREKDVAVDTVVKLKNEQAMLTALSSRFHSAQQGLPIGDHASYVRPPPARSPRRQRAGRMNGEGKKATREVEGIPEEDEMRALGKGTEMGLRAARRYWGVGY
ncbi:hypothetical protein JCM6882_001712, partial [Rhodosporidiobolus microsporus]